MRVVAGRAQRHFDLFGAFELRTAAAEQRFGVVRLDPSPQELDRHRELDRAGFEAFELQRVEPAHKDVVAELGAQHGPHLLAARLVSGREGSGSVEEWPWWSSYARLVRWELRPQSRRLQRNVPPFELSACVKPPHLLNFSTCTSKSPGQNSTVALRRRGCAIGSVQVFRNGRANLAPKLDRPLSNQRPALDGDRRREAPRNRPPHFCIVDSRRSPWLPLPCDCARRIDR